MDTKLFIKREIAQNVKFNEELTAGQEYNFACKLLLISNKLKKVNDFLTLRRFHDDSIGRKRQLDNMHYLITKFESHWITYLEVNKNLNNVYFNKYSLLQCIQLFLRSNNKIILPNSFTNELKRVFGFKYIFFYSARLTNRFIGRYHYFYNRLKD